MVSDWSSQLTTQEVGKNSKRSSFRVVNSSKQSYHSRPSRRELDRSERQFCVLTSVEEWKKRYEEKTINVEINLISLLTNKTIKQLDLVTYLSIYRLEIIRYGYEDELH